MVMYDHHHPSAQKTETGQQGVKTSLGYIDSVQEKKVSKRSHDAFWVNSEVPLHTKCISTSCTNKHGIKMLTRNSCLRDVERVLVSERTWLSYSSPGYHGSSVPQQLGTLGTLLLLNCIYLRTALLTSHPIIDSIKHDFVLVLSKCLAPSCPTAACHYNARRCGSKMLEILNCLSSVGVTSPSLGFETFRHRLQQIVVALPSLVPESSRNKVNWSSKMEPVMKRSST